MKKLLPIILFLLFSIPCFSKDYYVYIDKIGIVKEGEEAGHTEYGDVVGIYPYTEQYNPTRGELDRYKVIVMDLTREEITDLLENDYSDYENRIIKRARKKKLDIDKLKDIKQKEKVDGKQKVLDELITKPEFIPTS